jgi:hypothetical protein
LEKYRYGPLVYVPYGTTDDEEGNYYWNGSPPVGYDSRGIPIDKNGHQCLDISCPLHPAFEPDEFEHSDILDSDIPTMKSFKEWFDDNFLIISDYQLKKYIFKWWVRKHKTSSHYYALLKEYKSIDEVISAIWQHEEQTS